MGEDGHRRRSLILAGGGTKVAFQAGVLQVWLDEAQLAFDHADGASGGVFNLAMLCQGMSGTEIANNWRANQPLRAIEPNVSQWLKLPFAKSLFRLGRYRRNVLRAWGLDWPRIRSASREATFNLYNFTRHRHVVLTPEEMDEDRLISAVSLPMWFPPVVIDGDTYIDAVFVTDANIEEAIRRGADEVWVIWTVSEHGQWHPGFVAQYFQMIEAMANGQLRGVLARITRNNEAIAKREHAEFGRPIEVKILHAEVPLHYLLNFTRDRIAAAVELGVQAGRRWCHDEEIPLRTRPPPRSGREHPSVRFSEEMAGHVDFGEYDYAAGAARGRAKSTALMFHLTIEVEDLARFVVMPDHQAAARGWIDSDAFGGRLPVKLGVFNLFVDQRDPSDKRMLYRLWFRDGAGRPLTLVGHKVVRDDAGLDLWRDATTLYTRVLAGHVKEDAADAETIASGVLRVSPWAFARQLTTFRATAPTAAGRVATLGRFGRLFTGRLWDVYGRRVLSSSPF